MEKPSETTSTKRFRAWMSKPRSAEPITEKHCGMTKLHRAVINGDSDEVSRLLQEHSHPMRRMSSILTNSGRAAALDINAQDKLGRSPLHWAAARDEKDCAMLLMRHMHTKSLLKDQDGRTPLHEAVISDSYGTFRLLLSNEGIRHGIDIGDNHSRTALHWATEYSHYEMLSLLTKSGANISHEDDCNETALCRAARGGKQHAIHLFVEAGAKFTADELQLYLVAKHKEQEELGFESRQPDQKYVDKLFAFMLMQNFPGLVDTLLLDKKGTPYEAGLQQLLTSGDFDVEQGGELIDIAASRGYLTAVQQLIATGKVDINARSHGGWTPLGGAAMAGHEAIVQHLLETREVDPDARDSAGHTPLLSAVKWGNMGVVKQLLATKKVNINARSHRGRSPLDYAAKAGHMGIVQLLETAKADANVKDNLGRTPPSSTAEMGHEAVV